MRTAGAVDDALKGVEGGGGAGSIAKFDIVKYL